MRNASNNALVVYRACARTQYLALSTDTSTRQDDRAATALAKCQPLLEGARLAALREAIAAGHSGGLAACYADGYADAVAAAAYRSLLALDRMP